ncbi:MAG: glycoside hydrolase family 28 protein, partial [Muribaculaceae bacterium]|nr:glycoside hydrolase family 28 protein [Muribaculaceae bacterium]
MPVELAKVSDVVFPAAEVSVAAYGAKPDGATLCTAAIQAAIDALAAKGGGTVNFPAGVWLTGPIELRSNICLNLDRNAILYFSPDKELYLESDP